MADELRLTNRFQKSFGKLDRRNQERVRTAIEGLSANPHLGKPLKGELSGDWSLRAGVYRVLYSIEGNIVWIETVRHRREAYR